MFELNIKNRVLLASANPKATSGDLVANHMTAAAVSTAMAEVLGSAVQHQPLNVANTAANTIGAAIGTGIGSTFVDQLDAHYQQAEKGVQYTKQARRHSASMRAATAAEQHASGARPVAKPKPATRAYNPYNDPEILKAEAVANMSVPSAKLDVQKLSAEVTSGLKKANSERAARWNKPVSTNKTKIDSFNFLANIGKEVGGAYKDVGNWYGPSLDKISEEANKMSVSMLDNVYKIAEPKNANLYNLETKMKNYMGISNGLSKFSVFLKKSVTALDVVGKSIEVYKAPTGQKLKTSFEKGMEYAGEAGGALLGSAIATGIDVETFGIGMVTNPAIVIGTSATGGKIFRDIAEKIEEELNFFKR